tara:strand:- start:58455 stop:58562 length:108 start_codon:yes stop_codon:yes gene_type:complete
MSIIDILCLLGFIFGFMVLMTIEDIERQGDDKDED